jgi:hypothetical protein
MNGPRGAWETGGPSAQGQSLPDGRAQKRVMSGLVERAGVGLQPDLADHHRVEAASPGAKHTPW